MFMQDHCAASIREIDAAELQQMLGTQKDSPPLLIDVREPQEYKQAHIPGALLIPLGQLEFPHPVLAKNPARPTVVYCRSGKRSMAGATILCRMGFKDVMSLKGGIMDWHYETLAGPPRAVLSQEEVKSVQDLFAAAMGRELLAHGLYVQWSLKAEEPVKGLLQELSFREEAHMDAIYNRYYSWCRENDALPMEREQFKTEAVRPGEEKSPDPPFSSSVDLLELAVAKEFEAYNFYKTSAEMIGDEELRGLLFDLSFEERTHASLLLDLLAKI
jgi:sulfur-carrier protein adenylyltransferase/sulfurtransferase